MDKRKVYAFFREIGYPVKWERVKSLSEEGLELLVRKCALHLMRRFLESGDLRYLSKARKLMRALR